MTSRGKNAKQKKLGGFVRQSARATNGPPRHDVISVRAFLFVLGLDIVALILESKGKKTVHYVIIVNHR